MIIGRAKVLWETPGPKERRCRHNERWSPSRKQKAPHNLTFAIIEFDPGLRTWSLGLWAVTVNGGNTKNSTAPPARTTNAPSSPASSRPSGTLTQNTGYVNWGCPTVLNNADTWWRNKQTALSMITDGILGKKWIHNTGLPGGAPGSAPQHNNASGSEKGGRGGNCGGRGGRHHFSRGRR
ncbi:hypothetical protein R3P38DRAFT_2788390 [Favolaschia claudopus]|uniref:Uncharacterized protein n=1 Tax=Favolaschia claudopus TaxID=2862362 RepID=A0AAW0AKS6_9AGAR